MISVGATDDGGQVAHFSSYGKVDVVAPGDCVAVAEVPGVDQDRGCPGDNLDGVAFNSGTSFSAPVVSGVLALAQAAARWWPGWPWSPAPTAATRAASATPSSGPTGWPTPRPLSPPTTRPPRRPLVLETSGDAASTGSGRATASCPTRDHLRRLRLSGRTRGGRRTGCGQLRRRRLRHRRLRGGRGRGRPTRPPSASGDLSRASSSRLPAPPSTGSRPTTRWPCWPWPPTTRHRASTWSTWPTTTPGGGWTASTATTWTMSTPSPWAWRPAGGVDRQPLARPGGRPALRRRHHRRVRPARPDPGLRRRRGGRVPDQRPHLRGRDPRHLPARRVLHRVDRRLPADLDGAQRRRPADRGPRPRLQPQRRRRQGPLRLDRRAIRGRTVTSIVTSGTASVDRQTGGGAHAGDGGTGPGAYTLRVLYTGAGRPGPAARLPARPGHPAAADRRPSAAPNPFEPRPDDGDRDTTSFAMTSSEPGRLRVVIYRYASTKVVRVLAGGTQAAGRQRVSLDREDVGRGLAAGDLLLRPRGHRRRRQHLPAHSATTCGCCSAGAFRGPRKILPIMA